VRAWHDVLSKISISTRLNDPFDERSKTWKRAVTSNFSELSSQFRDVR
jgi:hypothetical protein